MTELDSLFKLDGDLDSLEKNVSQKCAPPLCSPRARVPANLPRRKQAVSTQTQELEALEARLRAAEDRLKQASSNSPPRPNHTQRRSPLEGVFPAQDKATMMGATAGARSATPASQNSADYVVVERPVSSQRVEAEKA
jgi:Tfp pilus assembly protein PilX